MCLFEKKLSLFKEVAIFSIILISFKVCLLVLLNIAIFRCFWFRTTCIGYVNCESEKEMDRICLFEKSCLYLKKLQFSL